MPSSKEYLEYVLDQLSDIEGVSFRAMMGEYVIYYRDKVLGGIYDDRFLVKPTESALAMMPDATWQLPYEGAKQMLLVDAIEIVHSWPICWKPCTPSSPQRSRARRSSLGR